MSFFATVGGCLSYEKQEDFDAALKLLEDGGVIAHFRKHGGFKFE